MQELKLAFNFVTPKDTWGEGPWQHEPDGVIWTDAETGLPCMALRNHMGCWCGYVGVGADNRASTGCAPSGSIHGGITYNELEMPLLPEPISNSNTWSPEVGAFAARWYGFDCAHVYSDLPPIDMLNIRIRKERRTYKTLDFVKKQCEQLAKQLVEGK
jgi:hypothetical protein